jgi:cation transport ATPase
MKNEKKKEKRKKEKRKKKEKEKKRRKEKKKERKRKKEKRKDKKKKKNRRKETKRKRKTEEKKQKEKEKHKRKGNERKNALRKFYFLTFCHGVINKQCFQILYNIYLFLIYTRFEPANLELLAIIAVVFGLFVEVVESDCVGFFFAIGSKKGWFTLGDSGFLMVWGRLGVEAEETSPVVIIRFLAGPRATCLALTPKASECIVSL